MARLSVDIPDSLIGEEKAKELSQARNRVKSLEAKVKKLELTHKQAERAVAQFRSFRTVVADSLDLFEDYPWE